MLMRNITLPTGPYDWHPDRVPPALYAARLATLRARMVEQGLTGLIVSGSTFDDGALAWLTGFTPKLGAAFAIVPAAGDVRLLFSGGPGMRPSASLLTWVEDVTALRGLSQDLAPLKDRPAESWGLWADRGLATLHHRQIAGVLGATPRDLTDEFDRLRLVCEPGILPLLRKGGLLLKQVEARMAQAAQSGESRWSARLAAERIAYEGGAQDLRMRLSFRDDGPAEPVDPGEMVLPSRCHAALALRADGYWLRGRTMFGAGLCDLQARWRDCLEAARPGVAPAAIAERLCVEFVALDHSLMQRTLDGSIALEPAQCLGVNLSAAHDGLPVLSGLLETTAGPAHVLWCAAAMRSGGDIQ
jgi:hypothetical protein